MSPSNNYSKWSGEELRQAELIAGRFLSNHNHEIYQSFQVQLLAMAELLHRLRSNTCSLEQRLDCFARISELSTMIQGDAQALFDLASEPVVARLLSRAR